MLIPLIAKDPERNDFTCRDGEIEFIIKCGQSGNGGGGAEGGADTGKDADTLAPYGALQIAPFGAAVNMTALHTLRIPLQAGEKEKAELMLSGQQSRVDPATAERLTQAMTQKAAECLLDLSTDLRRQGLFILPFRAYTMLQLPDGTLSYPSPQAVALPTDFPPHPEITAASVTDDALTVAIRFPVTPHRLTVAVPPELPEGYAVRTFISYPLYIPDPKEIRGSIGSVRSASGGQATGIRFVFLSESAVKASVAAPEKYHEMVGNERTGYRVSGKSAASPDYSCYAEVMGSVSPFPRQSLLALGEGVDEATDPLDWIADWVKSGEGYLPAFLPYRLRNAAADSGQVWPEGIDRESVVGEAEEHGYGRVLLTRPMTLADAAESRRHAEARGIRRIRVLGLAAGKPALGVLYGSDDCVRWEALRRFDPRVESAVFAPPRRFWRMLVMEGGHSDRWSWRAVILTAAP